LAVPSPADTGTASPLVPVGDPVSSPAMTKIEPLRAPRGLAATTWGPRRLDRLWVEDDRVLWHSAHIAGAWAETESLGGELASGPTGVAWAEGEMEVFAVMDDGELYNRYWDRSYWHPWESLGGELDPTATPAASAWGPERLDVYARGRDGRTWHRWWDGLRWVEWEQL
jgi:sialidase-1